MGDCGAMGQGGLVGDQDILKLAPGLIWSLSKHLELGVASVPHRGWLQHRRGHDLRRGVGFQALKNRGFRANLLYFGRTAIERRPVMPRKNWEIPEASGH